MNRESHACKVRFRSIDGRKCHLPCIAMPRYADPLLDEVCRREKKGVHPVGWSHMEKIPTQCFLSPTSVLQPSTTHVGTILPDARVISLKF